jgi:two-component system sensor histidine kinase ChvG
MSKQFRTIFGLRSKLLLMSAFLLVLPWLGYRYILEMEQYLSRGQQQVVLGTARALATALSERPELFNTNSYSRAREGTDLYVFPVFYPLATDDNSLMDWRDYQQHEQLYAEQSRSPNPANAYSSFRTGRTEGDPLSFRLMLGESNRALYAYLRVEDQYLVLRDPNSLRLDRSDALHLAFVTSDGIFQRYVVAPYEDEEIYAYQVGSELDEIGAYQHEPAITGNFRRTPEGYEYEVRLPLELVGAKLGLAIYDVDDPAGRAVDAIVSTSGLNGALDLGSLRRPTPEIDRIVAGMGHNSSRVRVIDRGQRVLLSSGDIKSATGLILADQEPRRGPWVWVKQHVLRGVYDRLLRQPTDDFVDDLYEEGTLEGDNVISALTGQPRADFRTLDNGVTRILEAAWPIVVNQDVLGAVVVDQNMNGIRTFRNQALETLFDTMLGILLLTVGALFVFATSLSTRIRSLRNQAERIIDPSGRFTNTIVPSRSTDEIGDLSRSFANIVERLGQYTHYLENMSSRLSHELRTPVTVVRSSLENLRLITSDKEADVYLQRAEEGIARLNLILTNMSEAARLEQILQSSEKEETELNKVVEACVAEYRQIYPGQEFKTSISKAPVCIMGTPEYIAQLMDKVVANAVDFSEPGKPIAITCREDSGEAVISISNNGPYLPDGMKDRMFDSMISVRPERMKKVPHLGMGLHIARMIAEYHGGYIYAENLIGEPGVIVVVRLPLHRK